MRFLIISHAWHKLYKQKLYSYAPYVREMNLWLKYVDNVEVVAPIDNKKPSKIDLQYHHNNIKLNKVSAINFQSFRNVIRSFFIMPIILLKLILACRRADHIHLRCPGNIGLLSCIIQIFFPKKPKTVKYAGNWDPKSKQPLSYKLQKWILSNTFLTKNVTVLVYGQWSNQSKNIKSFYTSSFNDSEKEVWQPKDYSKSLKFVFIGSLVSGKRPLLVIQIIEALRKKNLSVELDLFGEGILMEKLKTYVIENNLETIVRFYGNQPKEIIKKALKINHFTILPSKSEGWPKAIAEGMFFGSIPIVTNISCLSWMLDKGKRGILIKPNVDEAVEKIISTLNNNDLKKMSKSAQKWSQEYTLDKFDMDISKLLS